MTLLADADAAQYAKLELAELLGKLAKEQRHSLASVRETFAGSYMSSARVAAEHETRMRILGDFVDQWIKIEVEARTRFQLPPTEEWGTKVGAQITEKLERARDEEENEIRRTGHGLFHAKVAGEFASLQSTASRRLKKEILEGRAPPVNHQGGININVGANYGTIVGQIDNLSVGEIGEELRTPLRDLLAAASALQSRDAAREAQGFVRDLVNEIEKGEERSRSTLRLVVSRLRELLASAADASTVAGGLSALTKLVATLGIG